VHREDRRVRWGITGVCGRSPPKQWLEQWELRLREEELNEREEELNGVRRNRDCVRSEKG
jgi:hypothetical protein